MKPNSQVLAGILVPPYQYVVPVFQRFYRWDQPQWEKLWENLTELREPESKGQHFMGFLVFVPELAQLDVRYHVIDGQQRLTTLSLLLIAIRNVAAKNRMSGLASEITDRYRIDHHRTGDARFRVLLKQRDQEEYQAVVTGETTPKSRISSALSFFEHRVSELPLSAGEEGLRSFLAVVPPRPRFSDG